MADPAAKLTISFSIPLDAALFHRLREASQRDKKLLFEELIPEILELGLNAYDARRNPE